MEAKRICVSAATSDCEDRAYSLSKEMKLEFSNLPQTFEFSLVVSSSGFKLYYFGGETLTLHLDYSQEMVQNRWKRGRIDLARAVDTKKYTNVLDVTGGLGRDALTLAAQGCRVLAIERSKVLFELAQEAIGRARVERGPWDLVQFVHMDSADYLRQIDERPQVIYMDPMFSLSKKNALPKKELQVLRALLGSKDFDEKSDVESLWELSLKVALNRVVVKRHAMEPILGGKCSFSLTGKVVRYDVYVPS